MSAIYEDLQAFHPLNEMEARDRGLMLQRAQSDEAYRRNWPSHFTASAWVVNPERTKTLMIYHNIYQSWSWIGGHADGYRDLSLVAAKELEEETGVANARKVGGLLSCEILTVDGHMKRGIPVSSHLHLNATYLFEVEETEAVRIAPEENSDVRWFTFEEALQASTEPWMVENVYRKLIERSRQL